MRALKVLLGAWLACSAALVAWSIGQEPTNPPPTDAPAEEITPPAEQPDKPQLDKFHVTVAQFVGSWQGRGETQVRVVLLDRDIEVPEGCEFSVGDWLAIAKKDSPHLLWTYRPPADAEITVKRLTPLPE